jgi:hypothetical protein
MYRNKLFTDEFHVEVAEKLHTLKLIKNLLSFIIC